jgi:hypothetical protein
MSKIVSICAALILAAAAFSTSAEAQRVGGGAHFGGGRGGGFSGARVGGTHFSGPRVGGFSGARVGGAHFSGPRVGGARIGAAPIRGGRVATSGRIYTGSIGPRRYHYYGKRYPAYRYAYRHRGYRHGYYYGGYWPYWGWAFASAWPYDDYGYYYDYGDDSAVAYCIRRFRSYDPISRTYLGYDGRRHPCP